MKQCTNEIKEKIALYYDGGLSADEIIEIDEHIKSCTDCQEELELYRYILDELHLDENQENEISLPSDFHSDVMNRIKREVIPKKPTIQFTKYSSYANLAATFVLVLFLALIGFLQNGQLKDKSALVESTSLMTSSSNEENARMEIGMAAESAATAEASVSTESSAVDSSDITNYALTYPSEEVTEEVSEEATVEVSEEVADGVSLKITTEEKSEPESVSEGTENHEVIVEAKAENDGGVFLILMAILLILLLLVMIRIFYNKKRIK